MPDTESAQIIRKDLGEGLVEVVLNRAPVNALTASFLMQFASALEELAADQTVRAVVLSSAFKVYSAGLDLREAQAFDRAAENAIVDALNIGFLTQFAFPKPLVAAITGSAIAGGFFFVLAADWRVSGSNAKFGLAEVRVGADFPVGPLEIARATLDPNSLRRLMLTGQPMSATDAAAEGIIDYVCEAKEVKDAAVAKARELAEIPGATYARVKAQMRGPAIAVIKAGMEHLKQDSDRRWFGPETKSAMRKML
ncbi:enoyl-CoA hydratase/isomerase family protein [Seohaeicola saemankumensis]|uniref:Enoyl-CoA hydratase/isomerase family protein n=1 Tax=Seohaeicola saemankumensis TaxID=481181 RepID=A0ABW3TDF6_9RHOB